MKTNNAKNVIEYWMLCEKLKEVVRTGWTLWHVEKDRLESVAEHIYGTQMLAIAMWSEYGYQIDIKKIITMLACHELEEIKIGDMTPFDEGYDVKNENGHLAVAQILENLANGDEIKKLVFEFDARETIEAKFAYACDKMEANLQSAVYDEFVNLEKQAKNYAINDSLVDKHLKTSDGFCEMFVGYGRDKYEKVFDENFKEVAELLIKINSKKSFKK